MRMSEATETTRVHQALFVTMMVWGVNLSAVKGLTEKLDLMLVASVRMVLAALVLVFIARMIGVSQQMWQRKKWLLLVAAAFFLVYCQQIAFAEGLFRTSATNAALVMALGPTDPPPEARCRDSFRMPNRGQDFEYVLEVYIGDWFVPNDRIGIRLNC